LMPELTPKSDSTDGKSQKNIITSFDSKKI
jgi:hypothetical protein